MRSDPGFISSPLLLERATESAREDWSLRIDGFGCDV